MDLKELKAQAYDLLVQIQNLQEKLRAVNQAIANHKEQVDDGK